MHFGPPGEEDRKRQCVAVEEVLAPVIAAVASVRPICEHSHKSRQHQSEIEDAETDGGVGLGVLLSRE